MELHEIYPAVGSTKRDKRIGRGHGSGWGKTAGRGHKGQKARSGGGVKPGFEGGQMPIQRRLPKRGFTNIFAKKVAQIKIQDLKVFCSGATVGPEELIEAGLIKRKFDKIKVIANGEITKNLTVKAHSFSKSAAEKIESAGGKAEVI